MRRFIGYHGTDSQSANKIDEGFFINSDSDAWLGSGVYFFEDVPDYFDAYKSAKLWSEVVKKNKNTVVYKAEIISDKVFDMLNYNHVKKYMEIYNCLKKQHINAGGNEEEFSTFDVFNQIGRKVDVIRAVVDAKNYDDMLRSYITLIPQIQICVCQNSSQVIQKITKVI